MKKNRKPEGQAPRVALVYRNSRDTQEQSIERQRSVLEPYAIAQGWNVVARIEEDGYSGTEIAKRPGLQKVLAMARNGEIDLIGADDFDRLFRLDVIDLGEVVAPLRRLGVAIHTAAQGLYDSQSMIGRLNVGITSEGKYKEAMDAGRRTLTQQLHMARDLGAPPLARPAYGYRRVEDLDRPANRQGKRPGRLEVHEPEAEVVRQLFAWYADGYTLGWICAELYRRSVPTHRGCPNWRRSTVRKMLANPVYLGDRAWGKTTRGKHFRQCAGLVVAGDGTKKQKNRPAEEWFIAPEQHPAIIERDLWERCLNRRTRGKAGEVLDADGNVLRTQGEPSTPRTDPGAFILSRLLVCGTCGAWMSGFIRPHGKQKTSYSCSRYQAHGRDACVRCEVKEDDAVKDVIGKLRELLASDRQEWLRDRLKKEVKAGKADERKTALRKRVASLTSDLTRYRKRLSEVDSDMIVHVQVTIRQCEGELKEAEQQLEDALSSDPVRDLEETIAEAAKAVWRLEDALHNKNRLLLRSVLTDYLEKIVVNGAEYKTRTGKTRRKPVSYEVTLLKGTGLDRLVDLDTSCAAGIQVLHIDAKASA